MSRWRVLFLAVEGNRRRSVVEESSSVLGAAGWATVVIGRKKIWQGSGLSADVDIIDISESMHPHLVARLDRALTVWVPRLAARVAGHGRLRPWTRRATVAYQRRVSAPLHRRLLARFPARGDALATLMKQLAGVRFDHVVICDAASLPAAAQLVGHYTARRRTPTFCYGLDDVEVVDRA
jgi:hypothetical protein